MMVDIAYFSSYLRELLDEMNVELTSSWKEVKKLIKDDVRYSKFSSSDRVRVNLSR